MLIACMLVTMCAIYQALDVAKIIDFVLYIVYDRPKRKKTPCESRYAILFGRKGKKKVFFQTKQLPPDARSLCMKIPNLFEYGWKICEWKL